MKHWYPEVRIPSDVDIISKEHDWIPAFETLVNINTHPQYVDPDLLYTIKVSHAAWSVHWDKTMHDIVFLKSKGCKLNWFLYDLMYNDWIKLHGKKNVKLNVENDEFFTNRITRKYNHDELHEVLAFYDRPLHERIRKDLNSPLCSYELFNELSDEDKLKCAMEEVRVIATERFVLPLWVPLKHAQYMSLRNLITSMTTGWFNLYLIENFDKLIKYEVDTWQERLKALRR